MSDTFQLQCPSCSELLEADSSFFGATIQCPSCESQLEIPSAEEMGFEPAEEAAPE